MNSDKNTYYICGNLWIAASLFGNAGMHAAVICWLMGVIFFLLYWCSSN